MKPSGPSGRPSTSAPGWPRSPPSPRRACRRGRGAPPGCVNGRTTIWSSSTGSPPSSSWRPRRRPPGRPSRNRNRGPNSKRSGALMRALCSMTAARILRPAPRAAPRVAAEHAAPTEARRGPRMLLNRARLARMVARIDKPAVTRADLVEWVGALLPVDVPADPRALIEQITDVVGVRISAARAAHHREGHEKFTVDAVIAEEARIFDMIDAVDNRARLDVRAEDLEGLSADQARAIVNIAAS